MGRKIGAVVAGVLVVGAVVFALQWVGSLIHPLPPGVDPMDPDDAAAFRAHVATMPALSWALAFGSELLGAFLGALVAGRIAHDHRARMAGIVVGIALMLSVANWLSFSHPLWFMAGQLVAYPLVFVAVSKMMPVNPYEGAE